MHSAGQPPVNLALANITVLARCGEGGKDAGVSSEASCPHRYLIAGLSVASDLPMPGLIRGISRGAAPSTPDVIIQRTAIAPDITDQCDPYVELNFDIADVMRLSVRRGSRICYDPQPFVTSDDLALYLGGTGFGALLHQRRRVVLHASAVQMGDRAVLFCGASGAGKSTFAAALVDQGHPHIADDFCAIDFADDGTPMVAPDGRRHKLWENSILGLDYPDRRGRAVRTDMAKYYVDPRIMATEPVAISAIFSLSVSPLPMINTLAGVAKAAMIRDNAYRPSLVARLNQHRLYFETAASLAARCAIAKFDRPLDYAKIGESIAKVRDFVAALPQG